jgi:hypothetical protein
MAVNRSGREHGGRRRQCVQSARRRGEQGGGESPSFFRWRLLFSLYPFLLARRQLVVMVRGGHGSAAPRIA